MDNKVVTAAAVTSAVAFGAALAFYLYTDGKYRSLLANAKEQANTAQTTSAEAPAQDISTPTAIEGELTEADFVKVFGELLKQLEHWVLQLLGQFHQVLAAAKGKSEKEQAAVQQQVQMVYSSQVDQIVKKLMADVYPAQGVTDAQMRDFIRENQKNPTVQSMISKMKGIASGVISMKDDEYPPGFDMETLRGMLKAQRDLKQELKDTHCKKVEAEGKSLSDHQVKLDLEKAITADFKEQNKAIVQKYGLDELNHLPDVVVHCAIQKFSKKNPGFVQEIEPFLRPVPI